MVGRGAGPRTVAGCTLPALISASRGPAEAGTIRAITSPRSVRVISSPRFTRAKTFDVSWLSIRMDTSLTPTMYYGFVLHATAWLDRGKRGDLPSESGVRLVAPMPEAGS